MGADSDGGEPDGDADPAEDGGDGPDKGDVDGDDDSADDELDENVGGADMTGGKYGFSLSMVTVQGF